MGGFHGEKRHNHQHRQTGRGVAEHGFARHQQLSRHQPRQARIGARGHARTRLLREPERQTPGRHRHLPAAGTEEYDGARILRQPDRGSGGLSAGGRGRKHGHQPRSRSCFARVDAVQAAGTLRRDLAECAVGRTAEFTQREEDPVRRQHRGRHSGRHRLRHGRAGRGGNLPDRLRIPAGPASA